MVRTVSIGLKPRRVEAYSAVSVEPGVDGELVRGAGPRSAGQAVILSGLSVFLPAHNEEGNIERVVGWFSAGLPAVADGYEIIVVDAGSRDRTGEIADRLAAADAHVRVVHHPVNLGYGGAVI